jgi:hypothetical protein
MLPSAGVGADISVAWLPAPFRLEIAGSFFLPQTKDASPSSRGGAEFTLLGASAGVARAWSFETFEVGPAGGLSIEHLAAAGFGGSAASSDQSATWVAAQLGAFGAWKPTPRLALRIAAGAMAPSSRPSFVVLEPAPLAPALVHRLPAVTARVAVGAELRFF